jgi:hypothetical protein
MEFLADFLFMGIRPNDWSNNDGWSMKQDSFLYRIVEKIFENETIEFRENFKTFDGDAVSRFVCLHHDRQDANFKKNEDFFLFLNLDIILSLLVASPPLKRRRPLVQSFPIGLKICSSGLNDFVVQHIHEQLPPKYFENPTPSWFVNFDPIISQSHRSTSIQLVMFMQRAPYLACLLAMRHFADNQLVCDLADAQVRLLFSTAVFCMGPFDNEATSVETR